MHFPSICIIYALQALLAHGAAAAASKKSTYGEFCNQDIHCNSRAWLSCQDNRCGCIKPNDMIYEPTFDSCVAKAGGRCTFALDEVQENGLVFEVATCVPNAFCSPEGICVCNNHSYENSFDGTCTRARGYKEYCDSDRKCARDQALHCHDGLCKCDESVSIYEPNYEGQGDQVIEGKGQCVGLAGHICINSKCVAHAACSGTDNLCACLPDYYPDDDTNLCLPKMGIMDNCTFHYQCKKQFGLQLLCLNGFCSCNPSISMYATAQASIKSPKDSDYMKFSGYTGPLRTQCVGIAGSQCIDRLCVPHAFCSYSLSDSELKAKGKLLPDHNSKDIYSDQKDDASLHKVEEYDPRYHGICKCNKEQGYSESVSGFCGRAYAESCTPYSCMENLVCIDKLCSCPYDSQTYDSGSKTCVSLVGGPCNSTFSCGKKAECKMYDGMHGEGVGHCSCIEGYQEFSNGEFCMAGYETGCESSQECDSVAALECIDGMCRCGKFSEYNAKLRKCVGLVGAKCDLKEENECTTHAHCSRIHPKLPGSCVCDQGFFEMSNYTCRA